MRDRRKSARRRAVERRVWGLIYAIVQLLTVVAKSEWRGVRVGGESAGDGAAKTLIGHFKQLNEACSHAVASGDTNALERIVYGMRGETGDGSISEKTLDGEKRE